MRDRINTVAPHLTRTLSYGFPAWSGKAWMFSVVSHAAHCNLQLARGAELATRFPDRINGTGKSLRHVKVHVADDLDAGLDAILRAALALEADET